MRRPADLGGLATDSSAISGFEAAAILWSQRTNCLNTIETRGRVCADDGPEGEEPVGLNQAQPALQPWAGGVQAGPLLHGGQARGHASPDQGGSGSLRPDAKPDDREAAPDIIWIRAGQVLLQIADTTKSE